MTDELLGSGTLLSSWAYCLPRFCDARIYRMADKDG